MKRLLMESSIRLLLESLRLTNLQTLFSPVYSGIGHILMLHRVSPHTTSNKRLNNELELTPEELLSCIEYYINNNYKFISIDEVYDILKNNKVLDSKFVSFTFDDGYADILTYAYPILKNFDIPFTIHLTTGFIDKTAVLWWYLLEDLLSKHNEINFKINDQEYSFKCKTSIGKYLVFRKLRGIILQSNNYDEQMLKLHSIFDHYNIDLFKSTENIILNWDQIQALSNDPNVTIGSHTVNHLTLNKISKEEVKREIVESVKRIEEKVGKKVEHFSYPYGRAESGPREFEIVRSLRFKTATTTRFANIFIDHCDHLCCLPRIYKIGNIPKRKYLDVLASGALSSFIYKFNKIVTS